MNLEPIEPPKTVVAYMCLKLNSDGNFFVDTTATGCDMGLGFYSELKSAQKYQTLQALKLQKIQIYPIEWRL
jgi:hypothetical protein